VHDGVAQHVLQRREHARKDLSIEFAGRPFDHQFNLFLRFCGGLADDAGQALHVPLEGDHARAHQSVLHLDDGAALLLQQALRIAGQRLEQLLDAGHVARRLRETTRELLDRRVTVQFERIEIRAMAGL
jgi:hypothetical protein